MSNPHKQYNRIKIVLAQKRRNNNELAEYLGVVPSTVSFYVTNARQPSIERLYQIADFLGVEAKELLALKEEL